MATESERECAVCGGLVPCDLFSAHGRGNVCLRCFNAATSFAEELSGYVSEDVYLTDEELRNIIIAYENLKILSAATKVRVASGEDTPTIDWDAEAAKVVEYTARHPMRGAHRGAMRWTQPGIVVLFENRGERLSRSQARRHENYLREFLAKIDAEVLGIADADDGCTWAMLVRSDELERINRLAWQGWAFASGEMKGGTFMRSPTEWAIAGQVINDHGFVPGTPREPAGWVLESLVDNARENGVSVTPEVAEMLRKGAIFLTDLGIKRPSE
jgi:hypothetical protein